MKRLVSLAVISAALVQGCTTSTPLSNETAKEAVSTHSFSATNETSAIALSQADHSRVNGDAISATKDIPVVEGHPLTAVVVTQCNLVVAVYMTMPDGRLMRFDKNANIPAEDLVTLAYTATSSERVEVSCNGMGTAGYETHKPT